MTETRRERLARIKANKERRQPRPECVWRDEPFRGRRGIQRLWCVCRTHWVRNVPEERVGWNAAWGNVRMALGISTGIAP